MTHEPTTTDGPAYATLPPDGGAESPESKRNGLQGDAIGLVGATMLGIVIMGPALAVLFSWGYMIPSVGRSTAVLFIMGLALTLPTAYSYAAINRRMPSAGAIYKWASRLLSPTVGIAAGFCGVFFYGFIVAFTFPLQAQFVADLFRNSSPVLFAVIAVTTLLLALPLTYRGVSLGLKTAIIMTVIEVLIVVLVAAVAFFRSGTGQVSLEPLDPTRLPGLTTLMPALVLAFLAYTGYDAISTIAEETKAARSLIPKATILSAVAVGVFWVVISTVLSNALSPEAYQAALDEGGFPLGAAAEVAFGETGRVITDIMGMEATFALTLGAFIGSTRILYRMGRDGVLSERFGAVHSKFKTPWFSITAITAFVVIVDVVLAFYLSVSIDISLWVVNAVAFFSMSTYLLINVCNPLLFLRRYRTEFHWLWNGVIPMTGIAAVGWFFYKGFFDALWHVDGKLGRSTVWVCLTLLTAIVGVSALISRRPGVKEAARSEDSDDNVVTDNAR
ncbi:hypothetical protein CQY20_06385 [Mycolicibacterium agri]|uniref:Transporter n=1 Tax=Mycolicibacterium agri TaxID=36811 RepID=A0A2A7NAT3_MYCAG|nr:APC family permease [Mycolicibacterium agri]PEG40893.1 hypothetical protein CQY20_06385 [Mycolicibacterium agri]GFG52258.1 transporter [Mycolicibacterium agri]